MGNSWERYPETNSTENNTVREKYLGISVLTAVFTSPEEHKYAAAIPTYIIMCGIGWFYVLTILVRLSSAGATAIENVTVKEGDPVTQLLNIHGLQPISKLMIQKNLDNGTVHLLLQVCSPDEENKGCKPLTSPRVSVQILDDAVSVTFHNVTTSDAGYHIIEVTGTYTEEKWFSITVELPEINCSTQPPPSAEVKGAVVIGTFVVLALAFWSCFIWSIVWGSKGSPEKRNPPDLC